ncbi:MAG: HTTM domain-containing protein [Minicystis sp.]
MRLLLDVDDQRRSERHGCPLSEPRAGAPEVRALARSRAALGLLFLLRTTPILAPLQIPVLRGTAPLLGWPDDRWHGSPTIPLPAALVAALCVLRTVAAIAFMLGIEAPLAGIVAGVSGYLVLVQRPFGLLFTLHLLYLGVILLALTDCSSVLSPRPRPARAPASGILLIRLFVASVYAWAAIGKLRHDWFDGHTLEVLLRQRWLSGRIAEVLLATPDRRVAAAWAVALGEFALGPLLLWRRTRLVGLAVALAFHLGIEVIGHADLLGYEMMALLICFIPGALPQRGLQRGASAGHQMSP